MMFCPMCFNQNEALAECEEEKCTWWIKSQKACAINLIGRKIAYEFEEYDRK